MALFDGHHVRVSVMVRTSKNGASDVHEHIGWRIREHDVPYRFVRHPTPEEAERGSGPLWTGPMARKHRGSDDRRRALGLMRPKEGMLEAWRAQGLTWGNDDEEHATRETKRGVRHIAEAADSWPWTVTPRPC